jgi:hypothetical protein
MIDEPPATSAWHRVLRRLPLAAPVERLLERFVPRGAILLSVLTFGSYVMGLVRDRILTQTFGAGVE